MAFQFVFKAHQDLVQEVRQEGPAEDKEASPGSGRNPSFSGINLNNVDILFTQGLVAWGGQSQKVSFIQTVKAA